MPHVPRQGHSRRTHGRQPRPSHDHSGYLAPLTASTEVYEQALIDEQPVSPPVYPENSIPPSSVDHTPPDAPTGLTLSSTVQQQPDGTHVLVLVATLTHPTATDLFASYVEITYEDNGDPDPLEAEPVWTNAGLYLIPANKTSTTIVGVRGMTRYWARAYATDTFGNRSDYSDTTDVTTGKDAEAPGVPQNVQLNGGFKGIGMRWDASDAPDLMFNQVRYAPADAGGVNPDTSMWQVVNVRTSAIWIDGLTLNKRYFAQVRAVDFSGNVVTSDVDPTPVDYLQDAEAGWSTMVDALTLEVGSADIAANSIVTNHISTAGLDADVIKTGYLKVGTTDGFMDGLEIWYNGLRVGYWDETGLYMGETDVGLDSDLSASNYVRITDAGLTVYLDGVAQSAITPEGINATAVTFGALPGGHNLAKNSSFELAEFAAAPSTHTWTASADWTASRSGSDTNVTTGASALTMTASSY